MNKADKISQIFHLASGRGYKVLKAIPEMKFTLVDRSKNLFKNDKTGELITWRQIQERYIVDMDRYWGTCSLADCPEDELYFTAIYLHARYKDEVVIKDNQFIYQDDIAVSVEDSLSSQTPI
ncbi:MAG: hypothetical protein WKF89_01965 [Chitinophagaceae bacterium]